MGKAELLNKDKPRKRARATPPTVASKRAPAHYEVADKLRACTAMLSTNIDHPFSDASVQAAREAINSPGLSKETLFGWMNEYKPQVLALMKANPTPAQIVTETQDAIMAGMVEVRNLALEMLRNPDGKIKEASAYHLALIMGINQDHIHKLHKLSSERTARIYALIAACDRINYDYDNFIEDMIASIEAKGQEQPKYINAQAENGIDKP